MASATSERARRAERAGKDPSPERERPLGGYAALTATFAALGGAFAAWLVRSGRELPDELATRDLLLITLATHKLSRLLAKDRVTSAVRSPFTSLQESSGHGEVEERASGTGLRRAIGELVICPYCLGLWIAAGFAAGLVVAPRATRWLASALAAVFGADLLQLAYKRLEDAV